MTKRTRLPLAATALALGLLPAAASASPAAQLYFADRFNDTITHLPITSDGSVARVPGPDRNPDGTLTGTGGPAHVPAGPGTIRFRLTPDGRHGYALNATGEALSLYDVAAADGAVSPKAPATVATGPAPLDLAVDPRQRAVFVLRDDAIETFAIDDDGRLAAAGALAIDPGATRIAASPDGTALFAIAPTRKTVRRYALAADGTLSAAGSATLADYPTDLVVTHDSTRVYVATGGSIVALDAGDLTVLATTDALFVAGLEHLGLTPDDRYLVTTGDHLSVWGLGADGGATNVYASGNAADVGLLAFAPDGGMLYTLPAGGGGVVRDWILGPDHQPTRYATSAALTHIPRGVEADMTTTPAADLAVAQAVPATPTAQDGELTYKIVVANRLGLATGVRVRADLPENVTLVSATAADGGSCAAGGAVDCAVRAIGAGRAATVVVRARALRAGTATLTAAATALQPDADPTNNAETSSTAIDPKPGAVTVAAIDVTAGGARLTGVVAPAGTGTRYRFVLSDGTATPWTEAGDGVAPRTVAATVAGLAPGTAYRFRLVVTHDQGTVVEGEEAAFTTAPAPTPAPAPNLAPGFGSGHGSTPGALTGPDRTAPTLSGLGLTATTLRLRVSEAAAGIGTVERARTTRVRRRGTLVTTTRWTRVATVALRAPAAGPVTARLPRRLAAGRYRITVRLADAAGNRARPASSTVRVG